MKKGFTLVELLAVIAILAVLVIISLPNILKMFSSAKKEIFTNEVNQIIKATKQEYLQNGGVAGTYTNATGSSRKLSLTNENNLKYLVKTDKNGKIVKIQVTNGEYCYNKSGSIDKANSNDIKGNECTLNIDNNYNTLTEAVFIPGEEFNIKIKQLAGDDTSEKGVVTVDTNIIAILKSNTEPTNENKTAEHIVSTSDSKNPIYVWYDNGTIYWWSELESPSLNEDSKTMFSFLSNLINISGLATLNTSNVTTMYAMFAGGSTSNMKINDLTPLRNWDTSSVTDMTAMFQLNTSLTSLSGLENWDVSNVKNMSGMFLGKSNANGRMKIASLLPLKEWDTSSVTDMAAMFQGNTSLTSLEELKNWNVSKVKSFRNMFIGTQETTLVPLKNWNVSSATDMAGMFTANTNLLSLSGLENWNVSKVKDMSYLFSGNSSLTDANAINDWDVRNVTNFTNMFKNKPSNLTLNEFSKVNGTWNSEGTYIPSN